MAEFSVRNIFEAIYYSQTYAYVLTQLKDYWRQRGSRVN